MLRLGLAWDQVVSAFFVYRSWGQEEERSSRKAVDDAIAVIGLGPSPDTTTATRVFTEIFRLRACCVLTEIFRLQACEHIYF